MAEMTPLDSAHAAMEAADDVAARLRFYERLAASELYLLLSAEAEGDHVIPEVITCEGQPCVLAFDREDRLAEFAKGPAPYAALSGRALAAMLAGQGMGLGLNLGVAPSAIILPCAAVEWLAGVLAEAPEEIAARAVAFSAPGGLPEDFLHALDRRLAGMAGLARYAWLVAVRYAAGEDGYLLAFVGAAPGAEAALAQALSEVLAFSGLKQATLDVAFFQEDAPALERMEKCGLRFDLPAPDKPAAPVAPGSDPARPPRLR